MILQNWVPSAAHLEQRLFSLQKVSFNITKTFYRLKIAYKSPAIGPDSIASLPDLEIINFLNSNLGIQSDKFLHFDATFGTGFAPLNPKLCSLTYSLQWKTNATAGVLCFTIIAFVRDIVGHAW